MLGAFTTCLLLLAGCTGTLTIEGDGGTTAPPDSASRLVDGGSSLPSGDASSPMPSDGGVVTPPDASATTSRSCAEPCGPRALCNPETDRCDCIPGYVSDGAECVPVPVDDPGTRSAEAMCELWRNGRRSWGGPAYEASGVTCDAGSLPFAAHMEALSYLDTYRRLTGVGPVELSTAETAADEEQECALLQALNGGISHYPPMDWMCWTEAGARAAGLSFIASGFPSASSTVDAYIRETQSRLSHRRGLLERRRAGVYFGHHGGGGCCRYDAYSAGLESDPEYIFYPNAGFAPVEIYHTRWSVMQGRDASARFVARVFNDETGAEMPIHMDESYDGFSAFTLQGWRAEAGTTYRVELVGDAGTVVYRTTPTTCTP